MWNFFDIRRERGLDGEPLRFGVCKVCAKVLNASLAVGTNASHNHIKRCRPQPEVSTAQSTKVTTYDNSVGRRALARWVVTTDQAISIIENPEITEMIQTFQPKYQPVTRNTTRKDIMEYYDVRRAQITSEYEKGTFCVALTSDIWSARNKEDYISVVTHFIDHE